MGGQTTKAKYGQNQLLKGRKGERERERERER
jgi:hypothetical protein